MCSFCFIISVLLQHCYKYPKKKGVYLMKLRNFNSICTVVLLSSLFVGLPYVTANASKDTQKVTVQNYSFESVKDKKAKHWDMPSNSYISSTNPKDGSKCLKIKSNSNDFICVTQTVKLKPNTGYKLTGYIKGKDITGVYNTDENTGVKTYFHNGANITIGNSNQVHVIDNYNNWKSGTFGWTKVTVYFETTSVTEADIQCRLGHGWACSRGTAYFDKISITECKYPNDSTVNKVRIESPHVVLAYTKDFVNKIGKTKYKEYLNHLEEAYVKYSELTGSTPCGGDKIYITNTDEPIMKGYGGMANFNPILVELNQSATASDIKKYNTTGLGILHEMGHKFDEAHEIEDAGEEYGWLFDGELLPNIKMLYILDSTDDIGIYHNGYLCYSSEDYAKYCKEKYDESFENGTYGGDGMHYLFIKVVEKIGWEPFKKTFREYVNTKDYNSQHNNNYEKFITFIDSLQKNYNPVGTEVYDIFSDRDMEIIYEEYIQG